MALFRRRGHGGTGADPAFGFMSAADASEVRSLVRQALAERGLEVTVFDDHVVDASGSQFGLRNVMASCHNDQRGRAAWPDIVREHIRKILHSSATDPFASLTAEEAARRTYVRIYETASVPELSAGCYRDFAPGLVELLALDSPETVSMYPPKAVERLGGWAALRERGLANLASERDDQRRLQQVAGPQGVHFQLLLGPSVYTASQALRMPDPAAELASEAPGEFGWLLSVPNRNQLTWHMVNDISVVPSINAMAAFSLAGYNDAAGPLSPHVYWWDGSGYQQLTAVGPTGDIRVVISPKFQAVLERLADRAT
jgi:hypothetical protein